MILPLTYYKVDESLMLKIEGRGDATEDVLCCGWLPHRNDFIKSFCGNSFKCLIEGDGFGGRLGGGSKDRPRGTHGQCYIDCMEL